MEHSSDDPNRPFKLPRPHQLQELTPDQVVTVVLRLAMEVCVLRDRVRTHEALLAEHRLLSTRDVDRFQPNEDELDARQNARGELIEKIIGDLS